jgi:Uma2 family endonuclease
VDNISPKSDNEVSKNKVIQNLSVVCDKSGLNYKNYIGIATLVLEILSPSTAWIDISKKLELYQMKERTPRSQLITISSLTSGIFRWFISESAQTIKYF